MESKDPRSRLFEIANAQAGYFTGQQAKEVGYSHPSQTYHLKQNHWRDEGWGIFRLRDYPLSQDEQYVQISLWSRDRQGRPQGVFSHDTALLIHELSDVLPSDVHLTVPTSFRKRIPKEIELHKGKLEKNDIEARHGYFVTTPLKTIMDVADSDLSPEHLERAIQDALNKGLVRKSRLLEAVANASDGVKERFRNVGFK